LAEIAERHAAGESLRSLAAAHGTSAQVLGRHLRRSGYTTRSRSEGTSLANATREWGPSRAQGQVTANRKLRQRKREIVQTHRLGKGCEQCGIRHPAVLDLHHRDPADKHKALRKQQQRGGYRKGSSGRGWAHMSFVDIEAELGKCIVLCSNCHRIQEYEARKEAV